jgi:hypothetical protein
VIDLAAIRSEFTRATDQLEFEVSTLWREFQATDWFGNNAHFLTPTTAP